MKSISSTFIRKFSSSTRLMSQSYKSSITHLNSLQSNAATIKALRQSGTMNKDAIGEMRTWIKKAGVEQSDIDDLQIIHVAGTKGKGSTSAMVASILSKYRLAYGKTPKIGLYTSPHLKSVRERIQIDGTPIPEEEWVEYFYDVWNALDKHGLDKPVYFRFITILAFHAFIQECVDVVVLECGVGGEHDSTNIISRPVASGITSLGIDHVQVLGKTIEEIAWHKAGIFKPACPAFSVPQPENAMNVLRERANDRRVKSFEVVDVHPALNKIKLGLNGDFQKSNASLAIQLANEYLKTQGVDENLSTRLPEEFIRGLEDVRWPGRCEVRKVGNVEWCLDGAHTIESLRLTGAWFRSVPKPSSHQCLIFNQQSRDSLTLLETLHHALPNQHFTDVVFCTNKTYAASGYSEELTSINNASELVDSLQVQNQLAEKWKQLTGQDAHVVQSIEEAVGVVKQSVGEEERRVLVTGSLHLVGGLMTVLDGDSKAE